MPSEAEDAESLGFYDVKEEAIYQAAYCEMIYSAINNITGKDMTYNEYALAVINYSTQFTQSYTNILKMLLDHGVNMPSEFPSDWTQY